MDDLNKSILAVRLVRLKHLIGEVEAYLSPFGPRALLEVDRLHTRFRECIVIMREDDTLTEECREAEDAITDIEDAWLLMCEGFFTEETLEVLEGGLEQTEQLVGSLIRKVFEADSDEFSEEWTESIENADFSDVLYDADRLLVEHIQAEGISPLRR